MYKPASWAFTAFALLAAIACGDDGSGPEGSIAVSVSPTSLSVEQGGSGTVTVTLTRGGGFDDPVTVTVEGLPTGVTPSVTPSPLTGNTTSATVTVNVANTVAPGSYTATVRASATGVGAATAQYTLIVTAAAGFTISASPAAVNIAAGGNANSMVTIVRTNLTSDVALSLVNPPAGITGTFTPATLSGTILMSTLAISVAGNVQAGTYPLTVRGVSGSITQNATINVTVTAPAGGSITWEFCNNEPLPLKFWRQSGGAWAEVAPTVVGNVTRYIFDVTGTTGGVAFTTSQTGAVIRAVLRAGGRRTSVGDVGMLARPNDLNAASRLTNTDVAELTSPYFDTFVVYALASELSTNARVCDATSPNQVSKSFTLTGLGASEQGQLGYGPGSASLTPQSSSYNVMVPPGTYDWMAAFGPAPTFPDFAANFTHYRIGRGEVAPGGTVAIDRTGATAFVSTPFTVTGGNSGSFYTYVQVLEGANGSILGLPLGSQFSTTPSGNLLFLAANDRLPTDMNSFGIINNDLSGNVIDARSTFRYFGANPPASTAFALPAAVPAFTVTQVAGAPVTTWRASGQIPADYQGATSVVEASFQGGGETTLYTISATRGWLTANNMSTSYTLAGPTLPGFLSQWAPAAPLFDAQVIMFGSNLTGAVPPAGTIVNVALRLVESP